MGRRKNHLMASSINTVFKNNNNSHFNSKKTNKIMNATGRYSRSSLIAIATMCFDIFSTEANGQTRFENPDSFA